MKLTKLNEHILKYTSAAVLAATSAVLARAKSLSALSTLFRETATSS